jgi:dihydroorotate dehydrogenase (NAD+) catalytic subunit
VVQWFSLAMTPDLSVGIAGIRLKNPVIAASGTFGYGVEFAHLLDLGQLGGLVVKGLSREPMAGNPPVRMHETPAGMLNAIGLQNIGARAFVSEKLPELRRYDTAVFANVFGHSTEDYAEVIRILEDAEGLAGYELNISCPNTARGGMVFASDPALTHEVTAAAHRVARRPLIVKLSPNVTDITVIARAAVEAGADALSLVNTFLGMAIDLEKRRPVLANVTGGLSGPAIKPLALRMVYQTARAVPVPIIGLGGIVNGADALEFLVAGASAVEIGTASFLDPRAALRIIGEIRDYCRRRNIASLSSLVGSLEV